jgi:nucleoside-diphosphate-sugar epimerase
MKALITGAGGQIGSVLSRRLVERGDEVRGLFMPDEDDRGLGTLGVEVVRGDVTKPETLKGISSGCDVAFHLAARVEEWGRRSWFRETHYDGTNNMLQECAGDVDRFVYVSSMAYYGTALVRGVTEDTEPGKPRSHYQDMKILCERMVRTYSAERGLKYTIIRPSNVIGPRSAFVRNALDSFRQGLVPLVDGGSYNVAFVYVENLVDGIVLAADSKKAVNRAYNFCDDFEVTWREYFTALGALIGKKPAFSVSFKQAFFMAALAELAFLPFGKRPPFTPYAVTLVGEDNHMDCTRAREELGWRTRVTWDELWTVIERYVREECLP